MKGSLCRCMTRRSPNQGGGLCLEPISPNQDPLKMDLQSSVTWSRRMDGQDCEDSEDNNYDDDHIDAAAAAADDDDDDDDDDGGGGGGGGDDDDDDDDGGDERDVHVVDVISEVFSSSVRIC